MRSRRKASASPDKVDVRLGKRRGRGRNARVVLGYAFISLCFLGWVGYVARGLREDSSSDDVDEPSSSFVAAADGRSSTELKVYNSYEDCLAMKEPSSITTVSAQHPSAEVEFDTRNLPKALRVFGPGVLELNHHSIGYLATASEIEDCVKVFSYPHFDRGVLKHESPAWISSKRVFNQKEFSSDIDPNKETKTRIVFSCESSEYFGYQVWANAYGFLKSNQTNSVWLRLLTANTPDDLANRFPTFTAPRSLYSKRYSPINKADVIDKWFHSMDAPNPKDIIVVIDPDNWLLKSVHEYTLDVSSKKAVGEAAYYFGSRRAQKLWKEVCTAGCDNDVDLVGVPYVIQASDLKEVAPLWRFYSILLKEKLTTHHDMTSAEKAAVSRFKNDYGSLAIDWAAEMFGYNFACAHLGIKTKVTRNMQVRDVDGKRSFKELSDRAMVHMGRAWFPPQHSALAEKWRHTEGKSFKHYGIQVWCKCNYTASVVRPWPVPDGLDFQSFHTLRLMHESVEKFGPIPENEEYRRKKNLKSGYHWAVP